MNENFMREPMVRHQVAEVDKCAVLLEDAARDIRERTSNDPMVFRTTALSALNVARELLVTAGMFEALEVLS